MFSKLFKWGKKPRPSPSEPTKEMYHHNLMVALSALAQSKDEQLAYVHIGCAVCDLTEDFDMYGTRCIGRVDLTPVQSAAVDELRTLISTFVATEHECFDRSVLDRPDWSLIRLHAERCLNSFGYRLTPLPRPVQKEPGLWHLDILGHDLVRL